MAQKYYNPKTPDSILDLTPEQLNASVNTGDPTVTTEAQRLAKSGYMPYPSSIFSGSSSSNISQGSEDIRNEVNNTKNDAANTAKDISDAEVQMTVDDLKKTLGYTDPNAELTAGEKTSIELAGAAEGQQYDPLIRQAEEARLRGLPKADIGAGERGGFMNTQFAGVAALTPTQGGDFRGVGGELKRIENEYDANIQNLQSKKLQAIQLAKAKAEEAIRTGRKAANDEARELFKLAQEANDKAVQMQKDKLDIISKKQDIASKTSVGIAASLASIMGDDNEENFSMISEAAKEYGIDPNVLLGEVNKYKQAQRKADLEFLDKTFDVAKNIPKGETYTDPDTGTIIIGTKEGESMDVVKTIGGNEFKIRYDLSDPANPKELFRLDLGPRWKGGGDPDKATPVEEAIIQTVNYINGLKKSGQLNDITYGVAVNSLASEYGIADIGALQSQVNQQLNALEGEPTQTQQKETVTPPEGREGIFTTINKKLEESGKDLNRNITAEDRAKEAADRNKKFIQGLLDKRAARLEAQRERDKKLGLVK